MKDYLLSLDRQIEAGLMLGRAFNPPSSWEPVSKVIFFGMGGSAASGEILRALFSSHAAPPFLVERSERVPSWVDAKTLAIFSSYSGNTQEVLCALQKSLTKHPYVLVVSSGGKLIEEARRRKLNFIQIPAGLPPRCAIGYLTFALLPAFQKKKWLQFSGSDIRETLKVVREAAKGVTPALISTLQGRAIHLYAFPGLGEAAALRWRTQLSENSKTLASIGLLPEMFHNDVEGWRFPKPLIQASTALFLTDASDPASEQKKLARAMRLIRKSGAKVVEVKSRGKSPLARIFSLVALGDWASYELALRYGVNPAAIPAIDALKKVPLK